MSASRRAVLCDGAVREGAGAVTLTPETGGTLTTDIAWTIAQMGIRGTVLAPPLDKYAENHNHANEHRHVYQPRHL